MAPLHGATGFNSGNPGTPAFTNETGLSRNAMHEHFIQVGDSGVDIRHRSTHFAIALQYLEGNTHNMFNAQGRSSGRRIPVMNW